MARSARKGQEQEININLMPREEVGGSLGTTLNWSLGVGRYLIIFTQIIALVAFGLSLKLTIDQNNLNTRIVNAKETVDSKSEFEQEFREVQNKIRNLKKLRADQFQNHLVIQEFNSLLPKGVDLTSLDITESTLTFSGNFPTAAQLHTLINSFNKSTKIVGLEINELQSPSEEDPKFNFDAKAIIIIEGFSSSGVETSNNQQNNGASQTNQEEGLQ